MNFVQKSISDLLHQDIENLEEKDLKSLQKIIGGKIKNVGGKDKTLLIKKNGEISALIKRKCPKKSVPKKQFTKKKGFTLNCNNCKNDFVSSSDVMAFCRECRIKRQKDLIEIIQLNENGEVTPEIFDKSRIYEVESYLNNQTITVRLDLHGVTDLTPISTKLGNSNDICIISYVGSTTKTRIGAREDIMQRLKEGQIKFGVLVFARGRRNQDNYNTFHEIGSKAWFNQNVKFTNRALFVDDSFDHCSSVESLKLPGLVVKYFENGSSDKLIKILKDFTS